MILADISASTKREFSIMTQHDSKQNSDKQSEDFSKQAEEAPEGFIAEFWDFLIHNKRWWLTPIILVMLLVGALLLLNSTAVAPFIYTVF